MSAFTCEFMYLSLLLVSAFTCEFMYLSLLLVSAFTCEFMYLSLLLVSACTCEFLYLSLLLVSFVFHLSSLVEDPLPKSKRRKGGVWQRARAATEEKHANSCLFQLLMTMFAKGILSASQCHQIAQAAKKDIDKAAEGYIFPKLDHIAGIQHNRNLQGSVFRMIEKESKAPELFHVHIPLASTDPNKESCALLLPHELFAWFYGGNCWEAKILPTQELCEKFWRPFRGHPCMNGHPLFEREDFRTKCVPLGLHGDEVPISGIGKIWCRNALVLSWCSLLAVAAGRSAQVCMNYIWGCFQKFLQPGEHGTMEVFWSITVWSFTAIWSGKWPDKDWRGVRYPPGTKEARRSGTFLAGGFYRCLIQLSGDLDYYAAWLGVPRWSNHKKPCSQCRCSFYGPNTWLDNRPKSPWQSTHLTPETWRSH